MKRLALWRNICQFKDIFLHLAKLAKFQQEKRMLYVHTVNQMSAFTAYITIIIISACVI